MTIEFIGGEMGAFVPSDSTVVEATSFSLGAGFNSGFARCAIYIPTQSAYIETPALAAMADCWTHFDIQQAWVDTSASYGHFIEFVDGSDVAFLRMSADAASSSSWRFERWTGAAWSAISGTFTANARALQTLDIQVVSNTASGTVKAYVAGTLRLSGTADFSAYAGVAKVRFYGFNISFISCPKMVSQVVVADESTIGMRVLTRYPNAAGATSSWTGAYTDIDEIVYDDADFILSGTNNQISTFGQTGPVITGYTVRAVGVTARARKGASGPQHLRHALRVSGTDYFSGGDITLDAGYLATETIWETNPATSAAWVNTAIDALQPGVKSLA